MQKILIINTGGTIGMVHSKINDKKSPLRPSLSWEEVTVNYKFLEALNIDLSLITISEPTRLRRNSYAVFCLTKKRSVK